MTCRVLLRRALHLGALAVLLGCWIGGRPAQAESVEGLTELFRAEGPWQAAACGDLDGSGDLRVVAARMSPPGAEVVVYDLQGTVVSRWPVEDKVVMTVNLLQADEDREAEILTHGRLGDDVLTVYESDGTIRKEYRTDLATAPVLADVDGDGQSEILRVECSMHNSLQLLRADLTVSWELDAPELVPTATLAKRPEVGVGDLDADGRPEIVIRSSVWSLPPSLVILDAAGNVLREMTIWQGVGAWRHEGLMGVADLVPMSPGSEILLAAFSPKTGEHKIVALSGEGRTLLNVRWGRLELLSGPYRVLAVGNTLAVSTDAGDFLVFDGQGEQSAHVKGRNVTLLAGAADRSGVPVFVLREGSSLVVYRLESK